MSDIEEEWKPKGRPQSTMAQALADTLDSVFMLNSDVDTLSHKIHQKKQTITIQNWELEALHARIREAEERLKKQETMAKASSSDAQDNKDNPYAERSTFEQDESASSPISQSCRSEGGFTDASTAPSTTYNEDHPNDDGRTIRNVGLNKHNPERQNDR
ncbi:hypothetical protein D8B26_000342 [Coccidioides posadasii str. Silveira]|nr:hypothetical protein CPC735_064810 [Coccidioides posadasii C735 delta SOWgp]EER25381.1 hypothetical protein CPC735_064810 [Coccidioides posadasii C735 delta SOWgp]QVM05635.1 hypothetical protein D8B26_000342 [Coccidioides posadasii str. Silveira]|eukprot:XP_003067526.1 hypothetical protein CPC735_064810 [Coccidioides posadasii C735 delta SOWgp]